MPSHVRIGVLRREYDEMLQEMQDAKQMYETLHPENRELAQFWYGKYFVLKSRTDRLAQRFGFSPEHAS